MKTSILPIFQLRKTMLRLPFFRLLTLTIVFSLVSSCSDETSPEPDNECIPGTALCVCQEDGACPGGAGLACIDNVCIYPGCEIGDEGCVCRSDGSCNLDDFDRELRCDGATCIAAECPVGDVGCRCFAGPICNNELLCVDDICVEHNCDSTGSLGCSCNPDRSCDSGLACVLGECVSLDGCTMGTENCPCRRDGGCDADLQCNTSYDMCEPTEEVCNGTGSSGCQCNPDRSCDSGLACVLGECIPLDDCTMGAEDCPCRRDGSCDDDLQCDTSIDMCKPAEEVCDGTGTSGCPCNPDRSCDSGLACVLGECIPLDDCTMGAEDCPCRRDGDCDTDLQCDTSIDMCKPAEEVCDGTGSSGCPCNPDRSCNSGLACVLGECIPLDDCTMGAEDCPCRRDGGCDTDLQCDTSIDMCTLILCTPGTIGCECDNGACIDNRAICTDGLCELENCPPGLEGCECLGEHCGVNDRGEHLTCNEAGICESSNCPVSELGCVCLEGTDCAEGSECANGFCVMISCAAGEENCTCNNGMCTRGLTCRNRSICIDGTGWLGGACYNDGTCEYGHSCSQGICSPCFLGTLNCHCNLEEIDTGQDNGCNMGSTCSTQNICIAEVETIQDIPDPPFCLTPCHDDAEYCPSNGRIEGCVGGNECVLGSCVPEGEVPEGCTAETDCPIFQACLEGYCYSTCRSDRSCRGGTRCNDFVCRLPCSVNSDTCPVNTFCELRDTVNGYCMPEIASTGDGSTEVLGELTVDTTFIPFTNSNTSKRITVRNTSPNNERLLVRKLDHHQFFEDGTSDVVVDFDDDEECDPIRGECPLVWLEMGMVGDSIELVSEFEIVIEGNSTAQLTFQNAGDTSAVRWSGTIEIISDQIGSLHVRMDYAERPEGQWRGTVFYYTQFFEDETIDEWAATPETRNDTSIQDGLSNALLQRWGAFRRGALSWEEMQAVMLATETGSWASASELPECGVDACYLYGGRTSGVGDYSSDLDQIPVPTGVTELPFAMNLYFPDASNEPHVMEGRIDSSGTLHYAGDPYVRMEFHTSPVDCDEEAFGACLSYIDEFSAVILVGGRYTTEQDDSSCSMRDDETFTLFQTPWLLPDFQQNTFEDSGFLYRYECRDTMIPFDPESNKGVVENLSLAVSNPIPDGKIRLRTLELLDGVLVNQSEMVILFRERMDSFYDSSDDTEGISAYGYVVLRRQPTDLGEDEDLNGIIDAYEGNVIEENRNEPEEDLLAVSCSTNLLNQVLLPGESMDNPLHVSRVISRLISGIDSSVSGEIIDPDDIEEVHYLCVDAGLFDGGSDNSKRYDVTLETNNNSCAWARNGMCEDGGWNAVSIAGNCSPDDERYDCLVPVTDCELGTDMLDCGIRHQDDQDYREDCPVTSEVIYFTVDRTIIAQEDMALLPCQTDRSCQDTYNQWVENYSASPLVQVEAMFRCDNGGAYCNNNRKNLRSGKSFFESTETEALLTSFRTLVDQAFRYRTRFRARSGDMLGFAPEICLPGSNGIPYCYDPNDMEPLIERVDCLLSIWDTKFLDLDAVGDSEIDDALEELRDFLAFNFSQEVACVDGSLSCNCLTDPYACQTFDGFELLYVELLVMMGDEAYTKAFSSRFDLAGSGTSAFEGELFEDGGINLSGVTGHEMVNLYRATQYYTEALDRFYSLSPMIWLSVTEHIDEQTNPLEDHRVTFIEPEMVTTYMERLLRASTQRSRAWSQISKRYQGFNQQKLARRVIERAYTSTYLESIALTRIMQRIRQTFSLSDQPQIDRVLEKAALSYSMALLDMRNVYSSIHDKTTIFGLDPDYIPFPVMNSGNYRNDTAFELVFERAQERVRIARSREDLAIQSNRSYETDAVQFQAELVRIRNTYESQLGEFCGTFEAEDGRIYPATRKYASLDTNLALMGDPCGLVGNGQIFESLIQLDLLGVDLQALQERYSSVYERIDIERRRVDAQCEMIIGGANYTLCVQTGDNEACRNIPDDADIPKCPPEISNLFSDVGDMSSEVVQGRLDLAGEEARDMFYSSECSMMSLEQEIRESRNVQRTASATASTVSSLASLSKCFVIVGTASGSDCTGAALGAVMITASAAVNEEIQAYTQFTINAAEQELSTMQHMVGHYNTVRQCDQLQVDSEARMREMLLELNQLDLETLRLQYQLQLALSQIERLNNQATRIQLEQEEMEQLTINVEAARNDPNIRIYRNDAIINADYSFENALQHAYRATRVFEYYTTIPYEARDQLFLIRMIGVGDFNLENYMLDLQDAFYEFEEEYGAADPRVEILSLRDDLLNIPLVDVEGISLSQNERVILMRERLTDPALLDRNGYLTIPFSTNTETLSPMTRAHRIQFIEVDVISSNYGDEVARVYLRQRGTSVIDRVEGGLEYYRFPNRNVAVIDVFFGGTRYFDPEVYRTYAFMDRPYANTAWELVINQRDEHVNQDIDLQSVTDIRIYVYYNDFTVY